MNTNDLKAICNRFRAGVIGSREGDMMCAAVCYPLSGYLEFLGQPNSVEEVGLRFSNHVFLRLADGRILDPTADQFGGPKIYVGNEQWYHREYKKGD